VSLREGEEKIKERYRPKWTKALSDDDIIEMIKLIITLHSSTSKASEFTDKFIAIEEYRIFPYKEGTTKERSYKWELHIVIVKLKEHKNLTIRARVMEFLSKMNKPDFPTSRDEVLESLIELKNSNKLPSVHSVAKEEPEKGPKIISFTDGSQRTLRRVRLLERADGFYEVFVINAKGKFIKNKTVKGKKTKKKIADSAIIVILYNTAS